MVEMMIFSLKQGEVQAVYHTAKDLAARLTEEKWMFHCLETAKRAEEFVKSNPELDVICMDITAAGSISMAQDLRKRTRGAYMILIASPQLSPAVYMKPSIMAGSLLLRPLDERQVTEVMTEAFREFTRHFEDADFNGQFVIDNREGKWLVDYQQINYFESREKKIFLNTDTKEIPFYDTLEHLQEQLPSEFLRCHRSFLINGNKLEKLLLGKNLAVLQGGWEIPVSRSYKQALKEFIT